MPPASGSAEAAAHDCALGQAIGDARGGALDFNRSTAELFRFRTHALGVPPVDLADWDALEEAMRDD